MEGRVTSQLASQKVMLEAAPELLEPSLKPEAKRSDFMLGRQSSFEILVNLLKIIMSPIQTKNT